MRTQSCSATVWNKQVRGVWLLILAALTAWSPLVRAADPQGFFQASYEGVPQYQGSAGASFDGTMSGVDPSMYGPSESLTAWPNVSVYENQFDQTWNDESLWFRDVRNGSERYVGLDLLWYHLPRPTSGADDTANRFQVGAPYLRASSSTPQIIRLTSLHNDSDISTVGFSVRAGIVNPDETGFEMSGMLLGEATTSLFQPQITSVNPPIRVQIRRFDPSNQTALPSSTLFFAEGISVGYANQVWGGQANWYTTPIIGRGSNKIRGIFGARYLGIREDLEIHGRNLADTNLSIPTRTDTYITSHVLSQLVGPQAGLRWDLGGDRLKLIGTVTGGALANIHQIDFNTVNYGGLSGGFERNSTRISPVLDLGINAELPLFQYTPILNKVPYLRDGQFRFGYNYTAVFLMDRPATTFQYTIPLPLYDNNSSQVFQFRGWNFGITWKW